MQSHKLSFSHCTALFLVLVQTFFLTSCAGAGDWSYTELPGCYEIWQINPDEIALVKRAGNYSADNVVESYVSEIAWNDNFILVKQTSNPDDSNPDMSYYIVDIESEEVHGPLSILEFNKLTDSMKISLVSTDWIQTSDLAP